VEITEQVIHEVRERFGGSHVSKAELGALIPIRQWYNKDARLASHMPGTLFVVATPIGNLEDVSARALRILRQVTLIAAEDTRRTNKLLSRYAVSTPTTSFHEHNEGRKVAAVIERLQRGEDVALVSDAGTPTISDPGLRLIRAAIESGVRVEPVPGPSAAITALAASGIGCQTFTFMGFPPTRSKDRKSWLAELRSAGHPVVFFEAPHRIRETLEQIARIIGDCYVSVARELTKTHEEFIRGPISAVLEQLPTPIGEFTVVVDIGQLTDNVRPEPIDAASLHLEFGRMTISNGLSRRQAITRLARTHGLPPNEVYQAIEQAKKLV
jgi:16S rRNA (cytidine1402-2'-O)-methyltransferase